MQGSSRGSISQGRRRRKRLLGRADVRAHVVFRRARRARRARAVRAFVALEAERARRTARPRSCGRRAPRRRRRACVVRCSASSSSSSRRVCVRIRRPAAPRTARRTRVCRSTVAGIAAAAGHRRRRAPATSSAAARAANQPRVARGTIIDVRPAARALHGLVPARTPARRFGARHARFEALLECPQRRELVPAIAQNPTPSPASAAAPNAVVSVFAGRSTGTPSKSAWNCSSRSLRAAPPSTRSSASGWPQSCCMASMRSAVWNAMLSSAARAMCARFDPRVRPTMVPRAAASHCGAPSPANAGTR